MRVVFAGGGTGGHLYPGLAIARALVRQDAAVRPFFVGARRGIEREVLPTTEFPHLLLDLHPLYRTRPWQNWRTVRGALGAWHEISRLADEERPQAVVATGGYAAGVALGWAAAHGVPIGIQEQNSHPGLTTRLFARRAREVYLGFPEAEALMPHRGATFVDTGNPIEPPPPVPPDRAAARAVWGFPGDGRVVFVFGGSQGARGINDAVAALCDAGLPADWRLIWATGKGQFDRYARHECDRVRVRPYLAPIQEAYAAADVAVARGGAMGTAELCAWGIPSVIVPLPTAAADHQTLNARALAAAGAAVHLPQSALTADSLRSAIARILDDPGALATMANAARRRARPHAADDIARHVLTLARGARRS